MDYEAINKGIEEIVGTEGVEVSFQNIYQPGITPDFWKIANKKDHHNCRTYLNKHNFAMPGK